MERRTLGGFRVVALVATLAVLAVACGSSESGSDPGTGSTPDGTASVGSADADGTVLQKGFVNGGGDPSGTPVPGGSVTMGVFSEAASLDPVTSAGTGYAGGTEMAAVFDVLIRYDPVTATYSPQLAESLEPNEDNSVWTLKLRPGVTFSDGTPLDAEAVKTSIERQGEKSRSSFLITDNVSAVEVTDPLTVTFTLNKQWTGFPYVLAFHAGMITPPGADAAGDDFARNPIGAGPYTVVEFSPGEQIVMEARDDYWAGKPDIERLTFKYLAGAQANLDAIDSGTFQVALLGDPQVADAAVQQGVKGWVRINYGGGVVLQNVGDDARPTARKKVRQAVAHATDPEVLNARTWGGKAVADTSLYGPSSRWYSGVPGLPYDPEKAEDLVAEAMAEGWDGNIEIVASATPPWNNAGLAMQALLESVGMTVTLTQPATVGDQLRAVNVEQDYDLAPTGYALDEADPYVDLGKKFSSTAVQNASGYDSPEMDQLLEDLAAAETTDEAKAVIGEIQTLTNEDVPGNVWSHNPELLAWSDDVHGIHVTVNAMMLFTDAWVG